MSPRKKNQKKKNKENQWRHKKIKGKKNQIRKSNTQQVGLLEEKNKENNMDKHFKEKIEGDFLEWKDRSLHIKRVQQSPSVYSCQQRKK